MRKGLKQWPRYIRRHYSEEVILNPKTRRQRRHRARIRRIVARLAV